MKKFLALLLALVMVLSLAACGGGSSSGSSEPAAEEDKTTDASDPDSIEDSVTASDNTYEVAFITDVGQLKDKSFNQGTYDGVKLYAAANGKDYKYYQPANGDQATDDDRVKAMQDAVDGGAEIIVAAGFMQETAMMSVAAANPDVKFVFIDCDHPVSDANGAVLDNVAAISFQEEQSGYLAGYAVVMGEIVK